MVIRVLAAPVFLAEAGAVRAARPREFFLADRWAELLPSRVQLQPQQARGGVLPVLGSVPSVLSYIFAQVYEVAPLQ